MHGAGLLKRKDGMKYRGNHVDGKRDGQGTMTLANRDCHEGIWKDNLRHGHGIFK